MYMRLFLVVCVLIFTNKNIYADCISKDGNNLNSGFIECVKNGDRYIGKIDDLIANFLIGTWSTNCATMKSKIVNQRNSDGRFISQIYNLDSTDNTFKLSAFFEVLGLKLSSGLVYVAAESHPLTTQPPLSPQYNVSDYFLVVFKKIDENSRSIEDGYTIKDGVVEQEIKNGFLVNTNEKVIDFCCSNKK